MKQATGHAPAWDLAVQIGREAEGLLANILRSTPLVEVKLDRLAQATGQLYVEYEQELASGEWAPSGIATTEAHLWAFQLTPDGLFVLVPTDRLREVGRRAWLAGHRTVGGMDEHRTLGALVRLKDLLADLDAER